LRPQSGGIDKAAALVIGDQPDPQTALGQAARHAGNRGSLAGPEKTADQDVAGFGEPGVPGESGGWMRHGGHQRAGPAARKLFSGGMVKWPAE